jgi:dUTP pyrophosphatase
LDNGLIVKFRRLRPEKDADMPLPRYMTDGSAGMDIAAAVEGSLVLEPGSIALLPTGFAVEVPPGYEAQIRPRSGLAAMHGIGLVNSPGTIDSDYRGEIRLAVINYGASPYTIQRGDRVAQMVISRVYQPRIEVQEDLAPTDRASGGFGHTGK